MPKNKRTTPRPPALFDLEPETAPQQPPAPSSRKDADQFALEFVYDLTAPFIGYPGWGDDPQFWAPHKTRVTMDRLLHHQEIHRNKVASEYETMLYLSSASLAAPMSHDWGQVYLYLFTRCMGELAKEIGDEVTELNVNQREDLARLRRWIFRQQTEHLKRKLKGDEKPEKAEEEPEIEHPQLF